MNDISPFFILANPRSGSSLLRIICESHPMMTVPPECGLIEWWYQKYGDWKVSDNYSPRLEAFCNDLASSRKFETWNFDFTIFKELVNNKKPNDYSSLIIYVYVAYGLLRADNILTWGDKNNYYIHKTDVLNSLFPHSKFLHLIRDGRDVAASYLELQKLKSSSPYKPSLPNNVDEIAKVWDSNNRKILTFLNKIESERVFTLKYEDLILNLEDQCKSLCKFINVPFSEKMLEYYELNEKLQLEPQKTLDWKIKTLEKPDPSCVGKYMNKLSSNNISSFNSIAGQTLKEFGYVI